MVDEKSTLQMNKDQEWSANLVWEPMPVSRCP